MKLKVNAENLKGNGKAFFKYVELLLKFIQIIANYSYSFVFIQSNKYLSKYLKEITFENLYLTQYFKHIDSRRYEAGKKILLPLRKIESVSLTNPFKLFSSANSSQTDVKIKLFWQILLTVIFGIILFIEFVVSDFLTILTNVNKITSTYNSITKYEYRIHGTGILAKMLRSTLNEVNIDEYKHIEESSENCLPKIIEFNFLQAYNFALKIVLLFIVIFVEMFFKRLNRLICAYYYRKMEKKRTLWLYNSLMKKRFKFIEQAKQKITDQKKNDLINFEYGTTTVIFEMLSKYERIRKILKLVGLCKIKCAICNEKNQEEVCFKCLKCESIFCPHCCRDIENYCFTTIHVKRLTF